MANVMAGYVSVTKINASKVCVIIIFEKKSLSYQVQDLVAKNEQSCV